MRHFYEILMPLAMLLIAWGVVGIRLMREPLIKEMQSAVAYVKMLQEQPPQERCGDMRPIDICLGYGCDYQFEKLGWRVVKPGKESEK